MDLPPTVTMDDDPYSYPFITLQIVDLVLLSSAVVISLAGVYFAFKDLPPHAVAAVEVRVRPRTTALLTSLVLVLGIVPLALIPHHFDDNPSQPSLRWRAIRYIGAVTGVLSTIVTFLVLSFLIRLVDLVHRPTANRSSSSDSSPSASDRLIKGLALPVVLAIINAITIIFVLPDDGPLGMRDQVAADIVVLVLWQIINLFYLIIAIVILVRTRKRTSRGPLLAVAIAAALRYIYAFLSPFIIHGVSKLFGTPVLLRFVTAWGIVGVILTQCTEAIIVLVLIKVLAYHLADSYSEEEHQDPARRLLLSSASEQPAGTFNAPS